MKWAFEVARKSQFAWAKFKSKICCKEEEIMKKYLLLAMLLTLVAYAVPTYAAEPGEGSVSILFVQTSKGVAFDKGTMTLKGVSPSTVFFSDRPKRKQLKDLHLSMS